MIKNTTAATLLVVPLLVGHVVLSQDAAKERRERTIGEETRERDANSKRTDTKTMAVSSQTLELVQHVATQRKPVGLVDRLDNYRKHNVEDAIHWERRKRRSNKDAAKPLKRKRNRLNKLAGDVGPELTRVASAESKLRVKTSANRARLKKMRVKLNRMKASMNRAGKASKGVFWTQMLMAAWDASATERRLAEKEGRQVSKANQTVDFVKRVTGYSAFAGLHADVQFAVMDSMLTRLEELDALGEDITDREVFDRAYDYAYKQGIKAGIYGGAKLVPIVGDAINVKETADAVGELYNDLDASAWTQEDNENQQYQTWARAAAKAETALDLLLASVADVEAASRKVEKLTPQIASFAESARTVYHRQGEAIAVVQDYLDQQEALAKNPVAALLSDAAREALQTNIQTVITSANEQLKNIQRVKDEHKAGTLTAKGVATNRKFIIDLFEPAKMTAQDVRKSMAEISVLAKGSDLSTSLPQALRTIEETGALLKQLRERSGDALEKYLAARDVLLVSVKQYKESRALLDAAIKFIENMAEKIPSSINPKAADRIRAARSKAAGKLLDLNRVQGLIDRGRALTNENQAVVALSKLARIPSVEEGAGGAKIVEQAVQFSKEFSGPVRDMLTAVARVESGLSELGTLAGVAVATKFEPVKAGPVPKLSNNQMMTVTIKELNETVAGRLKDGSYRKEGLRTWAGFTVNKEDPKAVTARMAAAGKNINSVAQLNIVAPYYRIVKQGTLQMWWDMNENGKQDTNEPTTTQPYWIYYTAYIGSPNGSWGSVHRDGIGDRVHIDYRRFLEPKASENWTIVSNGHRPVSVAGADLAAAGVVVSTMQHEGKTFRYEHAKAFAGIGPFDIEVTVDTTIQAGHMIISGTTYQVTDEMNKMVAFGLKNWAGFPDAMRDFEFYMTGRAKVAQESAEWLVGVVQPYVEFSRKAFHFAAEPLLPEMTGLNCTTNIKEKEYLSRSTGRHYTREWVAYRHKTGSVAKGRESYSIYMQCRFAGFNKSWNDALAECVAYVKEHKGQSKQTAFDPGIQSATAVRAFRGPLNTRKGPTGSSAEGSAFYHRSEKIRFSMKNVTVTVEGYGSRMTQQELRTAAIARAIAANIARQNTIVPK